MCQLIKRCKNPSEFVVIHKAVGKSSEFRREACLSCAGEVGRLSPQGSVLENGGENAFYKIEELN